MQENKAFYIYPYLRRGAHEAFRRHLQRLFDAHPFNFTKQTAKEDIPAMIYKHYPAYAAKKMNVSELARVCKLSRPTVYKYLKLIA